MKKTFAARCIYQSPTGIRILQNPVFRWLQFDSNALQTMIYRYAPQRPALKYIKSLILAAQLQPEETCMLGLGGGGVAHALSPLLGNSKLVIVENCAEVIALAHRYFWIDRLKNIQIEHEDASLFMQKDSSQYQHLLIDLFTANNFPSECNTETFFFHCRQRLKPAGILAVNIANVLEHQTLFQRIQKEFLNATLVLPVPGKGNLIVFAQNGGTINPFLERLKRERKLSQLGWSEEWGYLAELR